MAINTRSPHYVSLNTFAYSVGLTVKIYTGLQSVVPSFVNYQLKKIRPPASTKVSFEISELISDFIDIYFDGNYTGQVVWVQTVIEGNAEDGTVSTSPVTETNLAVNGYSYFEEPNFNIEDSSLMISNRKLFVLADNAFRIPIYTGLAPTLTFIKDGETISTQAFQASTTSAEQVKYVSIYGNSSDWDSYKERVIEDGGTFEDSENLRSFFNDFEIGEVDEIRVSDSSGVSFLNIQTIEECKHEPKKITFINKFGVLQDLYFFKKSVNKMTVKKESYKANTRDASNDTYSISEHVNRDFNVVGNESTTLSSGLLSEEYNEVFKQMMLSEKVWITNIIETGEQVLPINVKTGNITYKTSLNDKLVEYTFDFENSYNTINNIR